MKITLSNIKSLVYTYINCKIVEEFSGYDLSNIKNGIMEMFLTGNSEYDLKVKEYFENNLPLKLYSLIEEE